MDRSAKGLAWHCDETERQEKTREQLRLILSIFIWFQILYLWEWNWLWAVCLCASVCEAQCVWWLWCVTVQEEVCARAFGSNDLSVPITGVVGVKEAAAESTCPPPPHTHTCTHILCPNPHITPHLVMKTSSIIPLDRPKGPKADSSLWGLLLWTDPHGQTDLLLTYFTTI